MYRRANGEEEFYSLCDGRANIDVYLDDRGFPTMTYPHVHAIHHSGGTVDVVVSTDEGIHPWRTKLVNPSGTEVERAVAIGKDWITVKEIGLLHKGERTGHISYIRQTKSTFLCTQIIWRGGHLDSVPLYGNAGSITLARGELFGIEVLQKSSYEFHQLI